MNWVGELEVEGDTIRDAEGSESWQLDCSPGEGGQDAAELEQKLLAAKGTRGGKKGRSSPRKPGPGGAFVS